MKIKKFNEEYETPDDYNDIADEYAKLVISKYLDDLNDNKTLQDSLNHFINIDSLDDYQEEQVLQSIDLIINKIKDDISVISNSKNTIYKNEKYKKL